MVFTPTTAKDKFQEIVNERGRQLRARPFHELKTLTAVPTEQLTVESRRATMDVIVQPQPSGSIRVVVQGFMATRWLPPVKQVALDGFYKNPDETIEPMSREEFYEFD